MTKDKTKKTKSEKSDLKKVEEITKELFELIGIDVTPEVSEDNDNDAILVDLKSEEEAGLIIGNRGRNLSSIQQIVAMIYRQRNDEWKRILMNVSDWREKEEERLTNLAEQTAKRAEETGEAQTLYNLTPTQRRIVHMALAEEKNVITESQGEGEGRYLIVTPKK